LHFIADFLDRNLWIKQSRASFVECLKGGHSPSFYRVSKGTESAKTFFEGAQ
jgi:hypothetical protein